MYNITSLIKSVYERDMLGIALNIHSGVDPNVSELGHSPLETAIHTGDKHLVEYLVSLGADINHVDKYTGLTPIMELLCKRRIFDESLVSNLDLSLITLFALNLQSDPDQSIIFLNEYRKTVEEIPANIIYGVLLFLCRMSKVEIVRHTINIGFDPTKAYIDKGPNPSPAVPVDLMYEAIINDNLEMMRLLNEHGVPVPQDEDDVLSCVENGDVAHLIFLKEKGLNLLRVINEKPIFMHALLSSDHSCSTLFENVDTSVINTKCLNGKTALHYAVSEGDPYVVELCLNYGVDPKIADSESTLPIDLTENPEIKSLLSKS